MKKKPTTPARWFVIRPNGEVIWRTASSNRSTAIFEFTGDNPPSHWKWRSYYRQGYRARRVTIEVQNGK